MKPDWFIDGTRATRHILYEREPTFTFLEMNSGVKGLIRNLRTLILYVHMQSPSASSINSPTKLLLFCGGYDLPGG